MSYGTADGPGRDRSSGPVLIVVALVVLGCLLSFLALRSADARSTATAGGTMSEPLRFVPVASRSEGRCPETSPYTVESPESGQCLTLATDDGLEVERLRAAEAVFDSEYGNGWLVRIAFLAEDAELFGDLTARAAARQPPGNQLAIVHGGELLTMPTVGGRIDGGKVEISGTFTQREAEDLAEQLRG
ncbi:SecDF P1 head subdomain-containing protein [Streptomyces litchfieldiae]|uniref:SecDF P1 head subdomain domain-containing protein n=1 Tax=Streptomyces litchfieldiae TaxID=3075543 RepID=A0ABU2MYT1_9ACTN|nr:hypothetical protein [Streptomyces sp. DSM 44938]MDT0346666.1 hypothetical protein [Streptomyces sp. DSM 44938]